MGRSAGESRRKPGTPANRGRPKTPYDEQIGAYVLEEMAKGQRSLRQICEEEELPDRSVIYGWVLDNEDFANQYIRAREIQQHSFADQVIHTLQNAPSDDLRRAQLLTDAMKWHAARLLPRVYGDQIKVEQTVTNAGNPELFERMTPEERETIRSILTAASQRDAPTIDHKAQGLVIDGREG